MHTADYVILGILMVLSMAVGLFFARRKSMKDIEQYLMASRSVHPINIGISIFVSFISGTFFVTLFLDFRLKCMA